MIIQLNKFGEILTSRPDGREAALSYLAYNKDFKEGDRAQISFDGIVVMTPSWLSEFVQTLNDRGVKNIEFLPSSNATVTSSIEVITEEINPTASNT